MTEHEQTPVQGAGRDLGASSGKRSQRQEGKGAESADVHRLSHSQLARLVEDLRERLGDAQSHCDHLLQVQADEEATHDQALRQSELRFYALARDVPALFSYIDADHRYQFVNRQYEDLLGRPASDIEGRHVREVLGPENYQRVERYLKAALSGSREEYDVDLKVAGQPHSMHVICSPDFGAGGQVQGIFCLVNDVTERRQTATRLLMLAKAVANLAEGVMITGDHLEWPGPKIIFVNDAMCRITGYEADELIGRTPALLQGDETDEAARAAMHTALAANQTYRGEVVNYRKDGTPYDAELLISPLFDAQGNRTHFVSVHRDVTEARKAQRAVAQSEARLRAILNTAVDAIITINRKGLITGVNAATERMFGYTEAQLLGQNVSMIMASPDRERHDQYLANYHRTGQARIMGIGREVMGRRKDGSLIPIDLAVSEVPGTGEYTGILRDISQRKKLERHLAETRSDERHHLAQELHDGLGSQMTGIGALARTLQATLEREGSPHAEAVDQLVRYVREAHQALRQVAHGLRPVDVRPDGLKQALSQLAQRIRRDTPVDCDFQCDGGVEIHCPDAATQLYRICEEAISNALRHADPNCITIGLKEQDRYITLWVQDDGRGFQHSADGGEGMGLHTMRYRAEQVGASFSIAPGDGGGTLVRCTLHDGHDS